MNNNELKFKPAWWLPSPHLQTLWPVLCRRKIKNLTLERERFELPDGDFIDLDWMGKHNNGPLVLILHGLEGSINSHYSKGMLRAIAQKNWRGIFMHFRGCSGEPNRLARSYHSGDTGDLASVLHALHKREPHTAFAAIGFSLGGNVLLKWLGETGKNNFLKAAVAVSVPFELKKSTERIQHGFSRLYQWHLLKCLRKRLMHKLQYVPSPIDRMTLSRIKKLNDFDDQVTAPMHGFLNACEYYTRSSSKQYLQDIQIPTLLLHAKDDPFMTNDVIPTPNQLPQQVNIELTNSGGHVGFVTGKFPWKALYWLEQRIPLYLQNYL